MRVIIIGKGNGWENAPPLSQNYQVWGVNDVCLRRPVDLAFNMHDLFKHKGHRLFDKTIAFVNMTKLPIVTQRKYEYIPTSIAFPLKDIPERLRYFTNSISYMVAYAWWLNNLRNAPWVDVVEMYGVVMAVGTEYAHQRPNLEYWMGVLESSPSEVIIHEPTFLRKGIKHGLYGYDWDEEDMPHVLGRKENQ